MTGIAWGKILTDAAAGPSYDPIPNGKYDMQITSCEVKTTKAGEVMFSYKATVQNGAHAKRVLFGNIVVPGPTAANGAQRASFLIRDLKNLGLAQEFIDAQPQPEQIRAALEGRFFVATVEQREYQGETKNEIKRINKAVAITGAPAPGGAGYAIAPVPGPPPAAAPPAPAPAPTPLVAPAPPGYAPPAAPAAPAPATAPAPAAAPPAYAPPVTPPEPAAAPPAPVYAPPAEPAAPAYTPPPAAPEAPPAPPAAPAPVAPPAAADVPTLPPSPFG